MHLIVAPSGFDMDYASCVISNLSRFIPDRVVIVDNVIDATEILKRGEVTDLYAIGHGIDCAVFNDGLLPLFMVNTGEEKVITGSYKTKCALDINLHLVKGVGVHLLACNTGKELAPALLQWGARYVIAYRDDFIAAKSLYRLPKPCSNNSPFWDVWTPSIVDFELHLSVVYGGDYLDRYLAQLNNYPNVPIRGKILNVIQQNLSNVVVLR